MSGAYLFDLPGLTPYREALALQRSLAGAVSQRAIPDTVILLEHDPVVTLGRRADEDAELHLPDGIDVEVVETDRGGKSTYHGPGQLVCYPILDLNRHGRDLKKYVRDLEEAIIRTLARFELVGERIDGLTGVWLTTPAGPDTSLASVGVWDSARARPARQSEVQRRERSAEPGSARRVPSALGGGGPPAVPDTSLASVGGWDSARARPARQSEVQRRERSAEPGSARREPSALGGGGPRKIASIGVHASRWVTTHGYALNVDLDPAPFTQWITACGLEDAQFTTIARELGSPLSVDDARPAAAEAIAEVFGLELEALPADEGAGFWPQPVHDRLAAR